MQTIFVGLRLLTSRALGCVAGLQMPDYFLSAMSTGCAGHPGAAPWPAQSYSFPASEAPDALFIDLGTNDIARAEFTKAEGGDPAFELRFAQVSLAACGRLSPAGRRFLSAWHCAAGDLRVHAQRHRALQEARHPVLPERGADGERHDERHAAGHRDGDRGRAQGHVCRRPPRMRESLWSCHTRHLLRTNKLVVYGR